VLGTRYPPRVEALLQVDRCFPGLQAKTRLLKYTFAHRASLAVQPLFPCLVATWILPCSFFFFNPPLCPPLCPPLFLFSFPILTTTKYTCTTTSIPPHRPYASPRSSRFGFGLRSQSRFLSVSATRQPQTPANATTKKNPTITAPLPTQRSVPLPETAYVPSIQAVAFPFVGEIDVRHGGHL
jgi:hypothetical protein